MIFFNAITSVFYGPGYRFRKKERDAFLLKLNARTKEAWERQWSGYNLVYVKFVCEIIARELDYPNWFIFPDDQFVIVFRGLFWDGAETISAMLEIERRADILFPENFDPNECKIRDIFKYAQRGEASRAL